MNKLQIGMCALAMTWIASREVAHALPEYPKQLQSAADTPCLPHCNVCHRDDNAGSGTIDRPFGKSFQAAGPQGGRGMMSNVAQAVEVLRTEKTDSDGDGVSDIDELSAGEDPNYAGAGSICGPQVGCSAASAQHGSWPGCVAACAIFSISVWSRRRRVRIAQQRTAVVDAAT